MFLEQVEANQYRDDIYIDRVITPHNQVPFEEKVIINKILIPELY